MILTDRHLAAVNFLVQQRFKGQKLGVLAKALRVTAGTLSRWRGDPDFAELYRQALVNWSMDLDDVQFRHRRARVEELQRLYEATPDEVDGKTQARTKTHILRQIAEEVGDMDPGLRGQIDVVHHRGLDLRALSTEDLRALREIFRRSREPKAIEGRTEVEEAPKEIEPDE